MKLARLGRRADRGAPVRTLQQALTGHRQVADGRDPRDELFLLAVTNLMSDAAVDSGDRRDARFTELVATVTLLDPQWVAGFARYLRETLKLRSAAIVAAAEYVAAGGVNGRAVIASVLKQADEPAELLTYWHATHGRTVPQPVKRAIADAARDLFTERSALRYDGALGDWRMGDVIEVAHPRPKDDAQAALFRWLLDRRHHPDNVSIDPALLPMVTASAQLDGLGGEERHDIVRSPGRLDDAGMRWDRLAAWLPSTMDAAAWKAAIPSMEYQDLLRNLRNFDDALISAAVAESVAARLRHLDEVRRSGQLPLGLLAALKANTSARWADALERALGLSVANVPSLPGRTLIMIDVSGSMNHPLSRHAPTKRWEVAALFGQSLAGRAAKADLFAYSNGSKPMKAATRDSVLRGMDAFVSWHGAGEGTRTAEVVGSLYHGHDRIIIVTDEQAFATSDAKMPKIDAPIFTFDLAGYALDHLASVGNRYTFGGLSDAAFTAIDAIEQRRLSGWPF